MKEIKTGQNILGWAVSGITPFVILMLGIRLLITPLFAWVQYHMPGFPDDSYGFTLEDRLRYSEPSIRYLVNSEDIAYLEALSFENGEPIYNARELSHMVDVKIVVTGMRIGLAVGIVLLVVLSLIAIKKGWRDKILDDFRRGSWILLGFIAAILLLLVINFNNLFTWFHQIFFESGTWLFYTSDTLIRLFPLRFWQNAFITVGLVSVVIASGVIFGSNKLKA